MHQDFQCLYSKNLVIILNLEGVVYGLVKGRRGLFLMESKAKESFPYEYFPSNRIECRFTKLILILRKQPEDVGLHV